MKIISFISIILTFNSIGQTIEQKFTNFELVANAKNVVEYDLSGITNEQIIDFDTIEKLFIKDETKSRKNFEYSFDKDGFITEEKQYHTSLNKITQQTFSYDSSHLLLESSQKDCDINSLKCTDFWKINFKRNQNDLTKIWIDSENKAIFFIEKYTLDKNIVIEEKDTTTNQPRLKKFYDFKGNMIKTIIISNGEKLVLTNTYSYYPTGVLKTKISIFTEKNIETIESYFPNGLLKSSENNNEKLLYKYKYDNNGNWIYKITYKNNKPSNLLKREIFYF